MRTARGIGLEPDEVRRLIGTPKVMHYRCGRCGALIPNDPTVSLSGCKAHEARVSWAPHELEPATPEHVTDGSKP